MAKKIVFMHKKTFKEKEKLDFDIIISDLVPRLSF